MPSTALSLQGDPDEPTSLGTTPSRRVRCERATGTGAAFALPAQSLLVIRDPLLEHRGHSFAPRLPLGLLLGGHLSDLPVRHRRPPPASRDRTHLVADLPGRLE